MATQYDSNINRDEDDNGGDIETGTDVPDSGGNPGTSTTSPTPRVSALAQALQQSPTSAQQALDNLRQYALSKEQSGAVPPAKAAQLHQALDHAEQLYTENTNRNNWLEVAQGLAHAVAQFGAAQWGKAANARSRYGVDMSGLPSTNVVDYAKRNEQETQGYGLRSRAAMEEERAARDDYRDRIAAEDRAARPAQDYLNEAYRGLSTREDQDRRDSLARDLNQATIGSHYGIAAMADSRARAAAEAREERDARREQEREDRTLYGSQVRDVGKSLQDVVSQKQATNQLIDELSREDLSGRDQEKIATKFGPLAAKAGISIEQARTVVSDIQDKQPSWYQSGKGDSPEQIRAKAFQTLQPDLERRLQELQQRRDQLSNSPRPITTSSRPTITSSSQTTVPRDTTSSSETVPATRTLSSKDVEDYARAHYPSDPQGVDKARQYLTSQGYRVEQ